MGKPRIYEPWGYREETNYISTESEIENDFDAFLVNASYSRDDNKIHFTNKDGDEKASIDVSDFVKSDSIVEKAWYEDGKIYIKFTNGDLITINVEEIIDQNEFADGLQVNEGVVSVLIDPSTEEWLTVSSNGVKVSGIQPEIERLDGKIDAEEARATAAEQALDAKIDQEISDREADVDAEETRAKAKEDEIEAALNAEITRSTNKDDDHDAQLNIVDQRLDLLEVQLPAEIERAKAAEAALDAKIDQEIAGREADVDAEEARATAAEQALQDAIDTETARATSAETELQAAIEAEGQRAQDAETALDGKIDDEITRAIEEETVLATAINDLDEVKFDNAEYDSSAKTINFFAKGVVKTRIDASDFIKDGMIDDVKIENGKLVITFNTDSGKESIEIPLSDIFDPTNYYTKSEVDAEIANEAATRLSNDETLQQSINDEIARSEAAESGLQESIDAEVARASSAETDLANAIELKADKETTYTQSEVDALIKAKETEIYNLTKLVGEIGGNVTYTYPNELGTSLTSLLGNYGTVKLAEDATISRFGPGVTAKNKVTLNLNNHNLTSTSAGGYGAIMARGTQEITIGGKGTVEAGDGVCIEANGASSVINLTGSTTVYHNNRPGGELIYCYAGTINITNGTFKNDGESNYTLNCYDANYAAGTAKIVVTGGKFYDFNPADNSAEGEHTSFVPEGYHVEESTVVEDGVEHTVYTVKKD